MLLFKSFCLYWHWGYLIFLCSNALKNPSTYHWQCNLLYLLNLTRTWHFSLSNRGCCNSRGCNNNRGCSISRDSNNKSSSSCSTQPRWGSARACRWPRWGRMPLRHSRVLLSVLPALSVPPSALCSDSPSRSSFKPVECQGNLCDTMPFVWKSIGQMSFSLQVMVTPAGRKIIMSNVNCYRTLH